MKFIRQVYASVKDFNADEHMSQATAAANTVLVWIVCRLAFTRISSLTRRSRTHAYGIHSLVSHSVVPYFIVCLYSLLRFLPKNPEVIIYDDGSLTINDCRLLKRLPRVQILNYEQGNKRASAILGENNILLTRRLASVYNRKLIDPFLFKRRHKKVLIIDPDILFFRYPDALISFLTERVTPDMIYMKDVQSAYIAPVSRLNALFQTKCVPKLNSGIIGINIESVALSSITRYYTTLYDAFRQIALFEPWIEQTGYAILASLIPSRPLPDDYSVGGISDNTGICVHYVHGMRSGYGKGLLTVLVSHGHGI